MSTTKSDKQNNGTQKTTTTAQPKAMAVISRYTFLKVSAMYVDAYLDEALKTTKNGALKITAAIPDCKGDIKGKLNVGDKVFYLVPSSTGRKGMFSAVLSFLDVVDAIRIWRKKLENTKTKEDYLNSAEGQRRVDSAYTAAVTAAQTAIDIAKKQLAAAKVDKAIINALKPTPIDLADIQNKVYAVYLSERGLTEETLKATIAKGQQ